MSGQPISRRRFLTLSAGVVGSAAIMSTAPRLLSRLAADPKAASWLHTAMSETIVPTVCLMCPSGCGMLARVADGSLVKVEGSPMHPINAGALCPKGQAVPELLYNPDRLTGPLRRTGERGSGNWEPISWEEAIQSVADKLNDLRDSGHPERAALLYGETRGQMRGFLERFMEAVGTPNAISHDSLNIEAAKIGTYLTQGVYEIPNYDFENSNYVLSFGASLLEAGRTPQRVVSGISYMRRGRATRGKVVVFDPREGVSGAKADEWIVVEPGTDAALALAMCHVIIKTGRFDSSFTQNFAFGFEDFKDAEGEDHKGFKNYVLENFDPRRVEQITGVSSTTISRIAGEFAGNQPGVAVMPAKGGLLNGGFGGVAAAMAIHCLNALVGNLETPGGVLTQRYPACSEWPELPDDPIAETGRKAERVDGAGSFFPAGRHAYQAVADRILDGYPVDALFLYDANPIYAAPSGKRFLQAFTNIPFIVSFTSFMDESAQYADFVLPEPTFLERWQDDYIEGLGYPGIALRQPVVEPLFDTMNSGDFLLQVAQRMGGPVAKAFPWNSFKELLQERLQDIGTDWETLSELGVWMIPGYRYTRRGSQKWIEEVVGPERKHAPRDGYFDFYSRELSCILGNLPEDEMSSLNLAARGDALFLPHYEEVKYEGSEDEFPLVLNIVTLMSLGPHSYNANLPTLQEISGMVVGERWGSWVELHPETAAALGLENKQQVWVESPFGRIQTKLRLVKTLHPNVVAMPHNQGHTAIGRWAKDRGVNGLDILNPASERLTGLASYTNTRVRIYAA